MFIEQPPWFYRALFPGVIWRIPAKKKCVYLTFDDGPIPEVTPWVLDILDKYGVVKNYTRNGSVIVFHDSLKAERNMREAMPRAIEWLQEQGYEFKVF